MITLRFIPEKYFLGGILGAQGLVFFALYLTGIFFGLFFATILHLTLPKKTEDAPAAAEATGDQA